MIPALILTLLAQTPPKTWAKPGNDAPYVMNIQGSTGMTPIAISGTISSSGAGDTVGSDGTFSSNGVCATVATAGQTGAGFYLGSGTLAATLTPSVSTDTSSSCSGGTWTATKFVDASGNTSSTVVLTNPNSAQAYGLQLMAGIRCARVCTTSFTSGTATGHLVASTPQPPPPAAGADVTDRAARLLGELTDGTSAIVPAKTGQLPAALDGSGLLKIHEQGTATVSGSVTVSQSTASNLKVDLSGTAANATAIKVDGSGVTQPVSGTFWQATQPVSAASLPLPSGAATAAKQPALGTAGSASTDVLSVQGIASGTALNTTDAHTTAGAPLSCRLTDGTSFYTASGGGSGGTSSSYGSAFPSTGTAMGLSDGTNMQGGHAYDGDTGAGTEYLQGVQLRQGASGGTVEAGTSSHPLRTDPTGTTTQPVSGTVTANQGGTWNITNVSGTVSLPTGAATSAKQPALGTAGSASSDVLTVQGIASMTALKVDGSAVTQPVSGTVSASQSGTWTVQPGNTANTTPWLAKISDGTNAAAIKAASTAAATTDPALVVTESPQVADQCPNTLAISQTTSTDILTTTAKLHVCSLMLVASAALVVNLVEGTGTTCATGTAALIGSTTAANGMSLAANGGFSMVAGRPWLKSKTTADHICLTMSGTGTVSGVMTYADQ